MSLEHDKIFQKLRKPVTKNLRVLLVNSPSRRLAGIKNTYFPLGLGYLAGTIENDGFYVRIYNVENPRETMVNLVAGKYSTMLKRHEIYKEAMENPNHPIWVEFREVMEKEKPDVVGFLIYSSTLVATQKMARIAKEINPNVKIVAGGPHPTLEGQDLMAMEEVDFNVKAEGEETFKELCNYLEQGKTDFEKIDGLAFKKKGKITYNKDRAFIDNVDTIPFPARHLSIYPELYTETDLGCLYGGRGCPYNCGFCSAPVQWGRKVRYRTPQNVVDEIKFVMENFGTREFYFWDDTFTNHRTRTIELCNKMMEEKLPIVWSCTTRVNVIDDELIGIMKKAGCYRIDIGVESGSPDMLKKMNKLINMKQIERGVELINKHGIMCNTFFMVGFPEETKEDVEMTRNLIKNIKAHVCLSIFTPYPGCELYDVSNNLGLMPAQMDWGKISHHSPDNHFVQNISKEDFKKIAEEMSALVDEHNEKFFIKKAYIKSKLPFYYRNPEIFVDEVANYMAGFIMGKKKAKA